MPTDPMPPEYDVCREKKLELDHAIATLNNVDQALAADMVRDVLNTLLVTLIAVGGNNEVHLLHLWEYLTNKWRAK